MENLFTFNDNEVITNCLWFYSHITNTEDEILYKIINPKLTKLFLNFITDTGLSVLTPALRCIGNILSGNQNTYLKVTYINLYYNYYILYFLDHN